MEGCEDEKEGDKKMEKQPGGVKKERRRRVHITSVWAYKKMDKAHYLSVLTSFTEYVFFKKPTTVKYSKKAPPPTFTKRIITLSAH